ATALGDAVALLNCEADVCPTQCGFKGEASRPLCGNGRVDPGEQCDDGSRNGAGACTARCLRAASSEGCSACLRDRCPAPYSGGLDSSSSLTSLLACMQHGPGAPGDPLPPDSCYFADPAQPGGSLVPCYCGSTPQARCLVLGPLDQNEACARE